MGLYGFKQQFVPFILSGRKTHTIRAHRAHPDIPGNWLHLYTGLRTKKAKLLMRVPCVKVEEIVIGQECADFPIWIDGVRISTDEKEALAGRDGFSCFSEMMEFWDGRLPFDGQIVHWKFTNSKHRLDWNGQCVDCGADSSRQIAKSCPFMTIRRNRR